MGRPLEGGEVRIVDPDTGRDLPPGTPGELRSRGYNTMKGYYKMPVETAQAIDGEGWLRTGDIAVLDEAGNYRITGRLDLQMEGIGLFLDGELMASAISAETVGGPLNSIRWLAESLLSRGESLRAGDIVIPGSAVKLVTVPRGALSPRRAPA
ncbi:MAG: AMP-binding protein [Acidobacteriota bacterium]